MDTEKICATCVLTDKTPGISFDENGVCSYCRSYVKRKVLGEDKLLEYLEAVRGTGEKYDCMIGISGGRDSTFTLWKLVNDYNMRVLAVNYMNPFTSEQARQNMQNALDILGVDLVTFEFPNDVHKRSTKKALKTWSHHPSSTMIPFVCSYCKLWDGEQYRIAKEKNISLVIIGSNPFETASFKKVGLGGARDYHKFSNLPNIVGKSLKELYHNPGYLVSINWFTILKMYLMAGHSSPYLRHKYKDIHVLRLFDYIHWNEKEVISTITEKLDWQKSPESDSSWRFDCRLDYVRRRMYATTHGVSELRDLFSKLIRENQMTRAEALKRLEKEDVVQDSVVENVLGDLDLKLADLKL